jgi:hypothetical protein
MPDIELFVHFAEIAGVFVGFGALIGLRSAQVSDVHDVVYMRAVLGVGVWVVIAALVPIPVSRYGVQGHPLWLSCALLAVALWAGVGVGLNLTAESRVINHSPEPVDRLFPVVGLPLHIVTVSSLLLILLGVGPGIDEALYITSLTGGVVFAGYTLLACVLSQRHESELDTPGRGMTKTPG